MNAAAERALAHATARLNHGWPLILVAFALFGPADVLARLVLLAAGALFTIARPPANAAAAKTRKSTAHRPATVPAPRKDGSQ
ncbi:hypothetical protein ACFCX4_09060 [Kitasatospora sp. NPDC056327]|uniref:hypothetical protein n=1 Tax=Kitasatospora sp. NPDC056327 TaxID=3345785 RepID=UPI0035E08C4E